MRTKFSALCIFAVACGGSSAPSPATTAPGATPVTASPSPPSDPTPTVTPNAPGSPAPSPTPGPSAPPAPTHTRCGWIDDPIAEASFVVNAAQFNTVHPKWYTLANDGVSVTPVGNPDLPSIVAAASANHVRIMPLIDAANTAALRTLINNPALRAQHIAALVTLVHDHGYAGMDIDYEHLFTAADRPGYTALMQEMSTAFHAGGYELSMALTAMGYDNGKTGYDYNALAAACDTLHVMAYDFHWLGGDHLGPLAPAGWVDAAFTLAEATGHKDRFMLGVANYAIGPGYFTTAADAARQCSAPAAMSTDHMTTCSYDHYDAGRTPHCQTAHGELWFEDVASMEEKVAIAVRHGARGVTYWTIGDELPGYFAMVKRYFP